MPEHLPLTGLPSRGLPEAALVCGDPRRADRVAEHLEDAEMLADRREYRSWRGLHRGRPVVVCSHGVGSPGAAIAFEELVYGGVRRLVRVGTCGGMQAGQGAGDLVVATASVALVGYARELVPEGFPAVADAELTMVLKTAVEARGRRAWAGPVLSRDLFYPGLGGPVAPDYRTLSAAGVQAVEMECAALFLVAALRGAAAGAVLTVDGNVLEAEVSFEGYAPHRPEVAAGVDAALSAALDAVVPTG